MTRHVLDEVDSTNAVAMRMAPTLAGPAWIMARTQTAGRGRRGRAWLMPQGNLAATFIFTPEAPADRVAQLSFVAAVALHDTLRQVVGPTQRLAIKWPNDVLLNDRKVAGILLESVGAGQRVRAVAIGVGVNLAAAPDPGLLQDATVPPGSVHAETGVVITPDDCLDLLAQGFDRWLAAWQTHGFTSVRAAWLARAARLGQTITARCGPSTHAGRFDDIDDTGALIMTTPAGRQVISAADVHFPQEA
ncbi:biotin--[acetyl-CoA-carboxylase] ligase [uncultured Paracoccus sp.]|uniref:biotin--[acetyl-CoA-carboxylase] ligase n=1 Tax=uncultured Paracoccus sp. TaxID=189685 RepID=UPI00260A9623|nr:biotin--[acetyl-CoA-carboxylase] ligase [uncultured Paracoccus sp.]